MTTSPRRGALAAAALLLSGCATTSLKEAWRDPADVERPVSRILVIGIMIPGETFDPTFEKAFAAVLRLRGYKVQMASGVFQPAQIRDPDAVRKWVRDNQGDLVIQLGLVPGLSSSLASGPSVAALTLPGLPGQAPGSSAGQGATLGLVPVQGQVKEDRDYTAEVKVFRFPEGTLVWRGLTETSSVKNAEEAAESLADSLVGRLTMDHVLVR